MTAPDEDADKGPTFAVAWERSFLTAASSFLASPALWLLLAVNRKQYQSPCIRQNGTSKVAEKDSTRLYEGVGDVQEERNYLVSSGTCKGAKSGLSCSSGRVDIGLEGGGVLVRHDW